MLKNVSILSNFTNPIGWICEVKCTIYASLTHKEYAYNNCIDWKEEECTLEWIDPLKTGQFGMNELLRNS